MRLLIAGGGTGGHIYPALAVARSLRERPDRPNAPEIVWLGGHRGLEADLVRDAGIRVALAAPDTFGALLAAGITAWLCIQAFINIGVVVVLIPVTGITLPFISAGGSSLLISLAAVGILLSISRETVERGTWNDASADRGRRHGRAHLPSPRRGPLARRPADPA